MPAVGAWTTSCTQWLVSTEVCLDTCLCFPCMIGRLMPATGTPPAPQTFQLLHCLLSTPPSPLSVLYSCLIRKRVVDMYKIDEGLCTTLVCGIFEPCSLSQCHRECSARNNWPGGQCFNNAPVTDFGN
jgi:Cys-rich protein (TIGR01571 family)